MAIMNTETGQVETNITGAVDFSFSKENAAKLAAMFSSYVYSDKEYAVISELASNAIDAHKMVGREDIPIKIKLPKYIDPTFVVRDFGPGMSEHDIIKYLTTYGETTKSTSNDFIGSWGIGSKSPAAITPTWSIISYHEGKKKQYQVFLNSQSLPSLKKIFESDTNETGLEVQVPVPSQNGNFVVWEHAAKKAFRHYKVTPDGINVEQVKYLFATDLFGWDRRLTHQKASVLTTMREYPIDASKLVLNSKDGDQNRKVKIAAGLPINVFMDIGTIDLSISRESIQYTEKTINNLCQRLVAIYDIIFDELMKLVDDAGDSVYKFLTTLHHAWRSKYDNNPGVMELFNTVIRTQKKFVNYRSLHDLTTVSIRLPTSLLKSGTAEYSTKRFDAWVINRKWKLNSTGGRNSKYGVQFVYEGAYGLKIATGKFESIIEVIKDTKDASSRIQYSGEGDKIYFLVDRPVLSVIHKEIPLMKSSDFAPKPRESKGTDNFKSEYYLISTISNNFTKIDLGEFKKSIGHDKIIGVELVNCRGLAPNKHLVSSAAHSFLNAHGYYFVGYKKGSKKPGDDALTICKNIYDQITKDPSFEALWVDRQIQSLIFSNQFVKIAVYGHKLYKGKFIDDLKKYFGRLIEYHERLIDNNLPSTTNRLSYRSVQWMDMPAAKRDNFNKYSALRNIFSVQNNEVSEVNDLLETCNKKYPMLSLISSDTLGVADIIDPKWVKEIQQYISICER
jgi:hypothetical protein